MVTFASEEGEPDVLNTVQVAPLVHLNRAHAVIYSCAILGLLYNRAHSLLRSPDHLSFALFLTITVADLVFAFMWALAQAFRWRPVRRQEEGWPGLDVFICTADPYKEPPMSVANTALSAMAFDYPTDRLSVYISDDGGSPLTLFAFMEAARFARYWLPFCREQGRVERCPEAYFRSGAGSGGHCEKIKIMYQRMKERVEKTVERGCVDPGCITCEEEREIFEKWNSGFSRQEHPPIIQVLADSSKDLDISDSPLPNLIYVSRGKSRASPHHFKAGALNALIRVSSIMTNGAVILTLDCDMYSNDPKAPQRALCYLLDSEMSYKLAYVQFPQRFRGINSHDTYGGPYYLGSACFFSRACFREASSPPSPAASLSAGRLPGDSISSETVIGKAHLVTGCDYERGTSWGSTTGIRYGSLSEDHNSGYHMLCRGWESVFCDPEPPAFLGDVPITLNDVLIQNKRWSLGLLQVGFSRYSPVIFGCRWAPLPMAMCYARYAFWPIWCIPVSIYAALPQVALVYQVPLFPKASDAWFYLYAYLFLTAYAQDLIDFLGARGTVRSWWNDQRMWMIRAVTSNLFGVFQFSLQKMGFSGSGFNVTSKLMDDEQVKRYDGGFFDFGAESPFFVSLGTIAVINLVSLAVGLGRSLSGGSLQDMFLQVLLSGFVVVNCWPIYEASVLRADKGRMPVTVIRSSLFLAGVVFCAAYFTFSTV
ncbi:unnamed protein product [Spirodela intermedia]|uniref:Uncharacterized protein n=1 Tax=Spirodela intermedia TaxID=51605 RepID=A0A7I8KXV3_SPIIN|nr:unnamed protein product [Spirodela intermedia]